MRLHDRYFVRELIMPLAACLGAFMMIWISMSFCFDAEHLRDAKLHFLDSLEYVLATTPATFIQLLPFILLLSMLRALTQLSRHNEITALRAAGVSLWRVCAPYFAAGLVAAVVFFAINELLVPACDRWSEQILTRYVKKPVTDKNRTVFTNVGFRNNRAQRIWKIGQYDTADMNLVMNPTVNWPATNGGQWHLVADSAVYTNGIWVFENAQPFLKAGPDEHERFVPQFGTNVSEFPEPDFDETPERIAVAIKYNNSQNLFSSRSADLPLRELWPYLRGTLELTRQDQARLETKFHARIAAPWTCLIIVLMAIPFGAQSGRRNLFYGVAGSIFICFAYIVLQEVSLAFGMGGYLQPWVAAWLPNFIFAAIGIFLTLRVR